MICGTDDSTQFARKLASTIVFTLTHRDPTNLWSHDSVPDREVKSSRAVFGGCFREK